MKIKGYEKFRIQDYMWEEMKQIIPKPKDNHPLGCHKPRIDNRKVMEAIFFVMKTGCQWSSLDDTILCKHSVAHKRFQEWAKAGVFEEFWRRGLLMYDNTRGLDLKWQSLDGSVTKAPLGGEKTGANPTDRAKKGRREALLQKEKEFLSELLFPERTGTTASLQEKPWRVFRSIAKELEKNTNSTYA